MRKSMLLCAVLAVSPIAFAGDGDSVAQQYTQTVRPFLQANCFECHGNKKQKAKINLEAIPDASAFASKTKLIKEVREVLQEGEMPPKSRPRPEAAKVQEVKNWLDAISKQTADAK